MSGLRQDTWLRAEASLEKPKLVARAATALPSKAALILRAIDALQRNDLALLSDLCTEAGSKGFVELTAALALLSGKPGSEKALASFQMSTELKLSLGGIPLLDILQRIETLRTPTSPDAASSDAASPDTAPTDAAPKAAPAFPAAPAGKFALESLVNVLSPDLKHPARNRPLSFKVSPRADQIQIAAANLLIYGEVDDTAVESYCARPSVLAFEDGGWLDASLDGVGPLVDWCEGRVDEWSDNQTYGLDAVSNDGGTSKYVLVQRACLGGGLRRVIRALKEGKIQPVLDPLLEMCDFASTSRAFPTILRQQCAALAARLGWCVDPTPNPDLLQALWQGHRAALPEKARIDIAWDLAEMQIFDDDPDAALFYALRWDAACYLINNLADLTEAAILIEDTFASMDRAAFTKHLRAAQVSAERTAFALGIHAASCGHLPQALDQIKPLCKRADTLELALEVFEQVLLAIQDRTHPLANNVKRQITELLEGFVRDGLNLPLLRCPVLVTRLKMSSFGLPPVAVDLLRRCAQSPLDPDAPTYPQLLAAQTATAALLDDEARARDALRDLGRVLRRGKEPSKEPSDVQAIMVAGLLTHWLPEQPPTLRQTYLEPISRFVLRDTDQARIANAIDAIDGPVDGIIDWFLLNRASLELGDHWRRFIVKALHVPEDIRPSIFDVLDEALSMRHTTSEALIFAIYKLLDEKAVKDPDPWDNEDAFEDEDDDEDRENFSDSEGEDGDACEDCEDLSAGAIDISPEPSPDPSADKD